MNADLTALLTPLAGEPSGAFLRYQGLYREVADARQEDDPNIRMGVWQREPRRADWALVERLCEAALRERSKDLYIAAWLAEAWVRRRGLDGLRDGLELMRGLVDGFWDDVHPRMEDGDLDYRLAPLTWFDTNVSAALIVLPVAEGRNASGLPYTLAQWDAMLYTERHPPPPPPRGRETPPSDAPVRAHFQAAAAVTPPVFFVAQHAALAAAGKALDALRTCVAQRMGEAAPTFAILAARLDGYAQALRELGGTRAVEDAPLEAWGEPMAEQDNEADLAAMPVRRGGAIRSREEAYRMLDDAADYLLRTEPHSPAPYLVKRAVSWGGMPLAELLQELLDSETDLRQIYRLLGTAAG